MGLTHSPNRGVSDSTLDVKDSHEERLNGDPGSTMANVGADIAIPSAEQQAGLSNSLIASVPAQTSWLERQTSTVSNRFEDAQRQYVPERQPDHYPWITRYQRRVINSQNPSHTVPADLYARKPVPATEYHHLQQKTYNNGVGVHASQADKPPVRPRASLEESERFPESKNQSNESISETPTSRQSMFEIEAGVDLSQVNASLRQRSWPKRLKRSRESKGDSNGEISETSTSRQSTSNNGTKFDFSQVDRSYGSNRWSYWGVPETPPSKGQRGRPPGSKNKPKDLPPPRKKPKGRPPGSRNNPNVHISSSPSGSRNKPDLYILPPPSHSYGAPSQSHDAGRQFRSIDYWTETPSKINPISRTHDLGSQWASVNAHFSLEIRSQPSTTATQRNPPIETGENACKFPSLLSPEGADPDSDTETDSVDIGARNRTRIQLPPVSSISTLLAATAVDQAQMVNPGISHDAARFLGEETRAATCSLHESSPSPFHHSYPSHALRNRAIPSRNNNIKSDENDDKIEKN